GSASASVFGAGSSTRSQPFAVVCAAAGGVVCAAAGSSPETVSSSSPQPAASSTRSAASARSGARRGTGAQDRGPPASCGGETTLCAVRRLCLIVNPRAGGGRTARALPAVEVALRARGAPFRVERTTSLEHALDLARGAAAAGEV